MTQILLIRHARNDWVGKRLPGRTPGIHLSPDGRREAEQLAARLDGYPLDAIFSSPLERAVETAHYLAEPRGLEVEQMIELADVDTGDWTGLSIEDLRNDDRWRALLAAPTLVSLPGGESLWDAQTRAVSALEEIRHRHPGQVIAVVAHADIIKTLVAHYIGLPLDLFRRLRVSTASVTVLRLSGAGPRLLALNDTGNVPSPPGDPPAAPPRSADGHEGGHGAGHEGGHG